jgi:hypothetical protein
MKMNSVIYTKRGQFENEPETLPNLARREAASSAANPDVGEPWVGLEVAVGQAVPPVSSACGCFSPARMNSGVFHMNRSPGDTEANAMFTQPYKAASVVAREI